MFGETIRDAYAVEGAAVDLGRGVHEGALAPEAVVRLPLASMNRHGLIAGATGTGKTKTLQVIAEQLSAQAVPVFVADVKGDLSGLAEPAEAGGPAQARMTDLGVPFEPALFPVVPLARRRPGEAKSTSSSSTRRTCCSQTRRTRSWSRSRAPCA
jgi:uncharacterized protein